MDSVYYQRTLCGDILPVGGKKYKRHIVVHKYVVVVMFVEMLFLRPHLSNLSCVIGAMPPLKMQAENLPSKHKTFV